MRRAYNAMIAARADDDDIDGFVDIELRRRPIGALQIAGRLNWLRREEAFPEACHDAPEAIRAAIGKAIVALRRRAPDAAVKLRALGDLACRGNLKLGLGVLAHIGPVAVPVIR